MATGFLTPGSFSPTKLRDVAAVVYEGGFKEANFSQNVSMEIVPAIREILIYLKCHPHIIQLLCLAVLTQSNGIILQAFCSLNKCFTLYFFISVILPFFPSKSNLSTPSHTWKR